MNEIQIILSLIGTSLGFIVTLLTFLLKIMKNKKIRFKTEKVINLSNLIIPLIKEAENFLNYSGVEKKNYVLSKLMKYSFDNEIDFDEVETNNKIEELLDLTKKVNFKVNENTREDSI